MKYDVSIMRTEGFTKENASVLKNMLGDVLVKDPVVNTDNSLWIEASDVKFTTDKEFADYMLECSKGNSMILRVQEKETLSAGMEFYYEDEQMMAHRELEISEDGKSFVYPPFYVKDIDVHKFEQKI